MVPQPRCINKIRGKVILKDTTKDAVAAYVRENCSEYYDAPPGFSFRGITLLLGEPMPLGLKRKKKKILVPFVKPCFGPMLVEVAVIPARCGRFMSLALIRLSKEARDMIATNILSDYLPIVIFLGIAAGLAILMVLASFLVARQNPDSEKVSPYECGFEPFGDARSKFDVRFYLVAILFIIFDLEIAFLFPWAITLGEIGVYGFWSMMIFLGVLTVGFIYEWRKGALDWE